MKTVIAVKAIGKTKPGGKVKLPANMARALVALGRAAYAPEPVARKTRQYQRRDMVAETPRSVAPITVREAVAPITGTITTPAARVYMPPSGLSVGGFNKGPVDDGKA